MTGNLADLSAAELLGLYRAGQASPVEATRAVLDRIDLSNDRLNAFRLVDPERALADARRAEDRWTRGAPAGPLDGVPASVKDVFLTAGWSTLLGSKLVAPDQPWDEDAPAVARLRAAGAVLVGKTNTSEFHWKTVTDSPLTGVTRNPWNPALTPGGSCGGAAVAVACGMAPLALGTDGGGSIRVPAAFTGVFGLKPTFGRVAQYPAGAFGTMAHTGPLTRTVADAALLMNVIARPDDRDPWALPDDGMDYLRDLEAGVAGLRVAFSPDLGYAEVDPEIAAVVADAVRAFAGLGAVVAEASPGFADARPTFETLGFPAIAALVRRYGDHEKALMDPGLVAVAADGARVGIMDYVAADRARREMAMTMARFHRDYDLLLTPTVPIAAFAAGRDVPDPARQRRWTEWAPFSYPFNLTRQPAASVPCGFTADGRPVGLQIVGPLHADALVLRAARAFERARPFRMPAADR